MGESKDHWDKRFQEEGTVWGTTPSRSAARARRSLGIRDPGQHILEIGCGYGRDMQAFVGAGHRVTGVDFSWQALAISRATCPGLRLCCGDVLSLPFQDASFDVIYGHSVYHLLRASQRRACLRECHRVLCRNGWIIQTVASVKDPDYGTGLEVEQNTFVNSRGVLKCYFTLESICGEFVGFELVESSELVAHHIHGEEHDHVKLYVVFRSHR